MAARQERSAASVAAFEAWMRAERAKLSRHAAVAKAIDYMLVRWPAFTHFLDEGRICLTNNAAERALRGLALGRKSWLFAGSERGAERAALMYTLIQTAKLNHIDPQAWLADVLARIANMPQTSSPISFRGTGSPNSPAKKPPKLTAAFAGGLPICRALGVGAALALPYADTDMMQLPTSTKSRTTSLRARTPCSSRIARDGACDARRKLAADPEEDQIYRDE